MQSETRRELDLRYAGTAARVDELEQLSPGVGLVAGLVGLRAEPTDAPTAVRVHTLWDKVIAWAAAQQMLATHDAINGVGYLPGLDPLEQLQVVAQEIAAATRVGFATASNAVDLVVTVGRDLAASWVALDRGRLSVAHIKALHRVTAHCPPRVVAAVDAHVVPLAIARGWTPSELARHARKVLITVDPDGAAERAAAAKADANVRLYPDPDETATLVAAGDAIVLREVMDTLNDRAEQLSRGGDTRPVGVRRLAALSDAVLGSHLKTVPDDRPRTQRRRGRPRSQRRAQVIVTVDLTTLLGLTDTPGELSGYGPITADTARQIAQDATLRRLVTDPMTGRGIDLGRASYQPSAALRRFVVARDRTCTFPGCTRPAINCQIDHRTEWCRGGCTDACNLHPLCLLHHNLKTKKLWHVTLNADGSETWRSALGFTYTKRDSHYPIELLQPPDDDHLADDADDELLDSDPDPPREDDPLPETPDLTIEEYLEYGDELERACYRSACFNYDAWSAEQRAS